MDFPQIRPIALFIAAFLNGLFAFLLWSRKNNKGAHYLGWLAFFSAIFGFIWAGVFFFEGQKLLWVKLTWLGIFVGSANMVFTYYLTGQTKFFKLKILFWYGLAAAFSLLTIMTPYVINSVSDRYPVITLTSAGPLNQPARIFVLFLTLLPLYYLIRFYRQSAGQKKLQIKYFITGSLLYIFGVLFFNGLLPLLFYETFFSYLDAPVYFSVIWLGLATYAIVRKNLFDIKIILTEMLVALISLVLFVQIFLTDNPTTRIIGAIIFILFCFIGYLLVRATHKELKKEQEAEKLAGDLNNLNKTLEKKVQEKTYELQTSVYELEKSKKALLNILDDIEEARHKIEEEKNKTLAIIANFADGLLVFDNKGQLTLVNPQAEIFFDIKAPSVIGKMFNDLRKFAPLEPLLLLLEDRSAPIFRKEMALRDLTLEVSSISINSQNAKIGDLIILHNVTREKLIERMKTEFVSVAAHQLRTPLSGVKWALSLLLDGDVGKINAEQKSFLQKSFDSNERMLALINDLLDVARIEEGKYAYNLAPSKMENLTQKAVDACKELAKTRKINISYSEPAEALPEVTVDAEKITIAMQNLIENAVKYTQPGGQVTISLKRDTNNIEFSVKDTGVGVNKAQQDRLFTKFFRAANVMLMETDGTGLGLFITKNIVSAHNGRIWFESEEGKGSTFSFSLPISH